MASVYRFVVKAPVQVHPFRVEIGAASVPWPAVPKKQDLTNRCNADTINCCYPLPYPALAALVGSRLPAVPPAERQQGALRPVLWGEVLRLRPVQAGGGDYEVSALSSVVPS